jgi:photosystem II stability/assembly factor-like uncharacterized protein
MRRLVDTLHLDDGNQLEEPAQLGYSSYVKKASITEAKNNLSALIDGVKTGGIFVSHDRGSTWSLAWEGENVYCAVELSDGTLFAGARRSLVLESTDEGMTWSRCPRVVEHMAKTYSLSVDRHDRLYIGAGSQLLRSADRARTWTVLDDGLDGMSIYDMQEGPDGTLVVATSAGMYVSTDGGDSWRAGRNSAS